MPEWNTRDRALVISILVTAAVLLFVRLDDRFLWQDEAETALLAKSVLEHGVPTAFDGKNLISQEGQQEFEVPGYRWFWTPWLQHYAAAGSFAVLGPSTWSARLPFVLFALGALWLCYALTVEITRDRRVAALAMGLLVVSVPFLLHARQCRYYAPASFFGLLLIWQYLRALEGRRGAFGFLILAVFGLFHSHYVVCAGFVIGLLLHFVAVDRRRDVFLRLAAAAGITLVLLLPSLIGFASQSSIQAVPGFSRSLASLHEALYHTNRFILPLVVPLFAGAAIWAARKGLGRAAAESASEAVPGTWRRGTSLVCVMVASVSLLALVMPWFFFRYYVALIPIGVIVQAMCVREIARIRPMAAVIVAGILLMTDLAGNTLPLRHETPPNSVRHLRTGDESSADVVGGWARFVPMAAYLYEISHDRVGPIESVVGHLEGRTKPGQSILATYGDLPLQFYTDLKVVGGLSLEDPEAYAGADWLLVRAHTHRNGDARLKRFIATRVERERYEAIRLDVLDVPYENRPDPTYHKFRDVSEGLPKVTLWRRLTQDPTTAPDPDGA